MYYFLSEATDLVFVPVCANCVQICRRYFNPEVYNIIQLDQRGCGKSTPHAELEDNSTQVNSLFCLSQVFRKFNFS